MSGYLLIGACGDATLIERHGTLAEAITSAQSHRGSPKALPLSGEGEFFWVHEIIDQIEFGGLPTVYESIGNDKVFYVLKSGIPTDDAMG